jgi:hypothetical protein
LISNDLLSPQPTRSTVIDISLFNPFAAAQENYKNILLHTSSSVLKEEEALLSQQK